MPGSAWMVFCGVNHTLDSDDTSNNRCLVNGIVVLPQLGFIALSSFILVTLKCCSTLGGACRFKYLLRLPGHSTRWLLTSVMFILGLAFLAEGMLTSGTYRTNSLPHQPHLFVPGICMVTSSVLSIVYYHTMEKLRSKNMVWLLLAYWLTSCFSMLLETVHIAHTEDAKWHIMRFDLSLGLLFMFAVMLFNELVLCASMFYGACGDPLYATPPEDTTKNNMKYVYDYVPLLSSLTYWWMNGILSMGYRRPIRTSDLGSIPDKHRADTLLFRFKESYLKEQKRAREFEEDISLFRVYISTYGWFMAVSGLFKLTADLMQFIGPLCISHIVKYVMVTLHPSEKDMILVPHLVTVHDFFANGFVLLTFIFLAAIVRHTLDETYFYRAAVVGIHVKSALQSMVYEKSLRLSTYAMSGGTMTMGEVTNRMSVDATNLQFCFNYLNELWVIPIRITVILILLHSLLGVPALIGASLFFLIVPIQMKLGTASSKYMKRVMVQSDRRLKSCHELLQGIKLFKLYGWEKLFCKGIEKIRDRELGELLMVYIMSALNFITNSCCPVIVNVLSFTTYMALKGEPLTPDIAFSALSLLNALTSPMFLFPFIISMCVNAYVSTGRLKAYFMAPEVEGSALSDQYIHRQTGARKRKRRKGRKRFYRDSETHKLLQEEQGIEMFPLTNQQKMDALYGSNACTKTSNSLPEDVAIRIRDGLFTWDPQSHNPVLRDLLLDIPAGKLTVVVGTVGSGKSSLLQAIMGEMTTLGGSVEIRNGSKMAFSPQGAWLLNASLRENITFGSPYNRTKYERVIDACALGPDIAMLPAGDMTEIGEKGINLSGGQKQRVSVARTMYSDRDIVMLDDPLSALDMHVGSHLFKNGILKILKKQKRTIILVTHQLQYLPEADKIIFMKEGTIALQGNPEEIADADPSLCNDWERAIKEFSESEGELSGGDTESIQMERRHLKKQSLRSQNEICSQSIAKEDISERGKLIVKEDQETGSISYRIYMSYLQSMNYLVTLGILLSVALRSGSQIASNFSLAQWSEQNVGGNNTEEVQRDSDFYLTQFSMFSAITILMRIVSMIVITIGCYLAAKKLHIDMLHNVIAIPMRFFDTTPTGRIINRFSSDTQLIDQRLVQSFRMVLNTSATILSALVVDVAVNIYFILCVIPSAVIFFWLLGYYLTTSRELQRCESVTRSPVFAHFSETLGGLPTIRAFKDQKRFMKTIQERISNNNRVYLYLVTAQRWIAIRLDYLGEVLVLIAGLSSVIGALYFGIDASYVGLSIAYSLEIAYYLNRLVTAAGDLELQMNAVERVKSYTTIPTEDYSGTDPPDSWPELGKIRIDDIYVRYDTHLDPVLKGVTLTIPPENKIGICGRTGSGKSSLTLALFRLIDTCKGRIIIDGIDIATVPLLTLRQRLSIIPQDAFLFTGSLRNNLDPTETLLDWQLWRALEIAQLKEVVDQLHGGLDFEVTEGGDNFSVGQRQLFCLARAFLRKSKIVIMDEATASIDHETDHILQETVAETFEDRTVITIAHRVNTIVNADTILTLSEGNVIEFDSPDVLLAKEDSVFASLVKAGT